MITYEWRTGLRAAEAEELADLLDRAARYDAEPEYSTIEFNDVASSMASTDSADRHLLIWLLPDTDTPQRIAGLVRLTGTAGDAEAVVVIDPELRSLGIMTLLLEKLSTDCGAKAVVVWARGSHPAAGRLSKRFLIPPTRRVWKLIRSAEALFVDSEDVAAVGAARLAGFHHDRTDVRYRLGGPGEP